MTTTHERQHYSRSQVWNLIAVTLWIMAIILFTTAAWSGNGYAGVTGFLFLIGGAVTTHKADQT